MVIPEQAVSVGVALPSPATEEEMFCSIALSLSDFHFSSSPLLNLSCCSFVVNIKEEDVYERE